MSLTIIQSFLKLTSIESVMPSNHLLLCHPLLLLPSDFSSIRVCCNKSALHIRGPKYWSFSISPSSEYSGLISRLEEEAKNNNRSVQSLSHVHLFVTPWTAAHQASLSFTTSCSLLKLMSIESVMPSNHLLLCHPPLLLPSIFPSIRVFSSELALYIRYPKY